MATLPLQKSDSDTIFELCAKISELSHRTNQLERKQPGVQLLENDVMRLKADIERLDELLKASATPSTSAPTSRTSTRTNDIEDDNEQPVAMSDIDDMSDITNEQLEQLLLELTPNELAALLSNS